MKVRKEILVTLQKKKKKRKRNSSLNDICKCIVQFEWHSSAYFNLITFQRDGLRKYVFT